MPAAESTPSKEVIVALTSPFSSDGQVDHHALAAHVEWCLGRGVSGVMPCGTTGEGPLLEESEVARIIETVTTVVDGRAAVVAHIGRIGTAATIRLAEHAVALGVTSIAAVVPYYYSLSDSQIEAHFDRILHAVPDTKTYAYCIPANTGNDLSDESLHRLVERGLAGVKDSTKSLDRHRRFLESGARVYIGTDEFVPAAFDAGAAGCISAIANFRPDILLDLRAEPRLGKDTELLRAREELRSGDKIARMKKKIAAEVPGYPTTVRAPLG